MSDAPRPEPTPTPDPDGSVDQPSDRVDGNRPAGTAAELDLDSIERDLEGVERALQRLDDGSYWTDEITGEAIPDHVLADDPIARRAT